MGVRIHEINKGRSAHAGGVVRDIRVIGDPVLRDHCRTVDDLSGSVDLLIDDMFATMYHARGVGLAANQIGICHRVFVFDCPDDEQRWHKGYLINPRLVESSVAMADNSEGCLSIPGIRSPLSRAERVTMHGLDTAGRELLVTGDGYFARCLLHELQHLDGSLFLDHLTGDDRRSALRALRALPR